MDSSVGDPMVLIISRETEIMIELIEGVLARKDNLLKAVEAITRLDCLLALSQVSFEHNWVEPEMISQGFFFLPD